MCLARQGIKRGGMKVMCLQDGIKRGGMKVMCLARRGDDAGTTASPFLP